MRIVALLIVTAGIFASTAVAEAPPAAPTNDRSLIGGINYEDSGPARNTYSETQDGVIDYFHKLANITAQLGQGASTGAIPAPSDNMLSYLNAVYLYCAVNYGECPMALDAILEADVINSKISKHAQCPVMTRFWKSWVRTDMEARHKYLVKTGFLKVTSDFNQHKRPRYIKCQETISTDVKLLEDDSTFFKKRYSADSSSAFVAAKMAKLLEELKIKVPNVFGAVGSGFVTDAPKDVGQVKVRR